MHQDARFDIVMLGTFSAWRLGTLQARALPFARELRRRGISTAIVTVPWDVPAEAGLRQSIDGVPLINTRRTAQLAAPLAIAELLTWIRRFRPRLVHAFKPKGFSGLASRIIPRHIPVVIDSDDWEGDGGWNRRGGYGLVQRRVFEWQERSLLEGAPAVTAASTLLARRARALRQCRATDAVWYVPNGIDADWVARLSAPEIARCVPPDAPPVIVLYSRFAEFDSRWLPTFATELDDALDSPAVLRIIGEPVDAIRLEGRYLRIDGHGYVARDELPCLLGTSSVAIYPYADSLIGRSKQSVKLLELMAAGCPVVASDIGDVARTVGEAGVALQSSDPRTYAATVCHLLGDHARIKDMRRAGPARVRERFDVSRLTNPLVEAYRSCRPEIGTPKPRSHESNH
jgi:glycosyltransferase involved in cell wall biosynthesis